MAPRHHLTTSVGATGVGAGFVVAGSFW